MQNATTENVRIKRVSNGLITETEDMLAVEEPLEIQLLYNLNDDQIRKSISVTMRTPGNDEELAIGFLFTEGIVKNRKQIEDVKTDPQNDNKVLITFRENEIPELQNADRNFYTTSSCGVCGKSSIDSINVVSLYKNIPDDICIEANIFYGLNDALRKHQVVFENTGGLHASALFDLDGKFIVLREDIGRHNALDKVIGSAFMNEQLPLNNKILLLSGRASFELVQKATVAGIRIIAAVGAPSSLAVQLAKDNGITLIGFLKNEKFNIYSGEERISRK